MVAVVIRTNDGHGWQLAVVDNSSVDYGYDGLGEQGGLVRQRDIDTNGSSDRPGTSSDQSCNQFFIFA